MVWKYSEEGYTEKKLLKKPKNSIETGEKRVFKEKIAL